MQPLFFFDVKPDIPNLKLYALIYIYDKSTLKYVGVNWLSVLLKSLAIIAVVFSVFGLTIQDAKHISTESEVMIIMTEQNKFSADKLIGMIKEMNFSYPHIVLAQAILETSNFQSNTIAYPVRGFHCKHKKASALNIFATFKLFQRRTKHT